MAGCFNGNAACRRVLAFVAYRRARYTEDKYRRCSGSSGAIEEVHLLRSGSRKALPLLFLIHISVGESLIYQNCQWIIKHSISCYTDADLL